MILKNTYQIGLLIIFLKIYITHQHAYMSEPPSRASAWLTDPDFAECCSNYDYNQMFCGGARVQWDQNGGKCGICGDQYDMPEPRTYEKGGSKYLGKIVRNYVQGTTIPITIQVTANHLGYFEFRVCKVDGWETDATQKCLNQTLLKVQTSNEKRFLVNKDHHQVNLVLILPENLKCNHCVLQWKYVTGNSWGFDSEKNVSCLGCGPVQEHFYGCSDISIIGNGDDSEEITETTTETATEPLSTSTEVITTNLITEPTTKTTTETTTETIKTTTTEITTTTEAIEITETQTTTKINTEPEEKTTTTEVIETSQIVSTEPNMETTEKIIECRLKVAFGTKVDISRIVSIYCNRMCNLKCRELLLEYERSVRHVMDSDIIACLETCPLLCDCS